MLLYLCVLCACYFRGNFVHILSIESVSFCLEYGIGWRTCAFMLRFYWIRFTFCLGIIVLSFMRYCHFLSFYHRNKRMLDTVLLLTQSCLGSASRLSTSMLGGGGGCSGIIVWTGWIVLLLSHRGGSSVFHISERTVATKPMEL